MGLLGTVMAAVPAMASGQSAGPVLYEAEITSRDRPGEAVVNTSPVVLASPADGRIIVVASRVDAPRLGCALHLSRDSGRTWEEVNPVAELPDGIGGCYAPDVAFDGRGTLYYMFSAAPSGAGEGVFLTRSRRGGTSFNPSRRVLGPGAFGARMAIDPTLGESGRLHLVWVDSGGASPPRVMAAHSDDAGATFSSPVPVSDAGARRPIAPAIALAPDGSIHVAYYDAGGAADSPPAGGAADSPPAGGAERWSVVVATSDDGGARFGRRSVAGQLAPVGSGLPVSAVPAPALAAGNTGVCVAWSDAGEPDPAVFASCSGDRARDWPGARRLGPNAGVERPHRYLPSLAMSTDGRVDAVFYAGSPGSPEAMDVYLASSSYGGRSFTRTLPVTRQSFTATPNPVEFGSRPALLSRGDEVLVAWAAPGAPAGTGVTRLDLFAASVQLEPDEAERRTSTNPLLVPAFVLLGVIVFAVWRGRRRALLDGHDHDLDHGRAPPGGAI